MVPRKSREERQQETRASLLDAAELVFAERGIHLASLDDVAAAAGFTKGAVYSNFASKAELLLELMGRRQGEDVVDAAKIITDISRPSADRFETLGETYARGLGEARGRQYAMLLMEFWLHGMREPASHGHAAAVLRSARAGTQAQIKATSQEVDLPVRTDQLAALTIALDVGIAVQHLIDPEEVPGELFGTAMRLIYGESIS